MKRTRLKPSQKPIRRKKQYINAESRTRREEQQYYAEQRKIAFTLEQDCVLRHFHKCSGRLETDHIIPRSQGGTDHHANLQILCHHHHINFKHGQPTFATAFGLYGHTAEILLKQSCEYSSQWHKICDDATLWLINN